MIQRSSRTTSLLGSSLNSSQLSLYSHASSRSGASRYDGAGGSRAAELARVSSGGQASKAVGGHGYLTSSRTVSAPKGAQSKSKGAHSQARERRKQDRSRKAHTTDEEESLVGDAGVKDEDLESYLMAFGGEKAGPGKATAKGIQKSRAGHQTRKSVLPRGSELDWDKLLESGGLPNETQSEDDDVFTDMEDPGDLDGSAFLKIPTKMDSPVTGPPGEQTKDKLRRISNVSSDIKFLGENSASPSLSDFVLTDSLDTSSTSNTYAPVVTEQPGHHATRNLLSRSDHSLERNALKENMEVSDLVSRNEIDVNAVHSLDRSKPITMRNRGANFSDSVTISEEQSISESKVNVLSSIDKLEADINEVRHQSEESSFEQNLHDVHSLQELEEILEDSPSHNDKGTMKLSTSQDKGKSNNIATKSSTLTKREQSPVHSPESKPKLSGFKFSATNSTIENIFPDKQQKAVVSYSSDEFESESVSEVESLAARSSDSEHTVKEESVVTHSDSDGRKLKETVASGDSDIEVEDRTETRDRSGEHRDLSYSSFSEDEQMDKSGRAEYM